MRVRLYYRLLLKDISLPALRFDFMSVSKFGWPGSVFGWDGENGDRTARDVVLQATWTGL